MLADQRVLVFEPGQIGTGVNLQSRLDLGAGSLARGVKLHPGFCENIGSKLNYREVGTHTAAFDTHARTS